MRHFNPLAIVKESNCYFRPRELLRIFYGPNGCFKTWQPINSHYITPFQLFSRHGRIWEWSVRCNSFSRLFNTPKGIFVSPKVRSWSAWGDRPYTVFNLRFVSCQCHGANLLILEDLCLNSPLVVLILSISIDTSGINITRYIERGTWDISVECLLIGQLTARILILAYIQFQKKCCFIGKHNYTRRIKYHCGIWAVPLNNDRWRSLQLGLGLTWTATCLAFRTLVRTQKRVSVFRPHFSSLFGAMPICGLRVPMVRKTKRSVLNA